MLSHPDLNFEALAKDGFHGSGLGQKIVLPDGGIEHIVRISLDVKSEEGV